MTEQEAKAFDRYSVQNAVTAEKGLEEAGICDGTCKAYDSIFTYNRWAALGYQVQRGQHGARIAVLINTEVEEDGEVKTLQLKRTSVVFCRHQVERKGA